MLCQDLFLFVSNENKQYNSVVILTPCLWEEIGNAIQEIISSARYQSFKTIPNWELFPLQSNVQFKFMCKDIVKNQKNLNVQEDAKYRKIMW